MSIGLYDVDFFKYHQVMFNLEIMKMAAYFKGKREITMLSPDYSPDRYTKFYLRKDFYDGTFPPGLTKYDNLEYGGLAFTKNVYVPLEEEIERVKPDTYVYDRYKNLFLDGLKSHSLVFTTLSKNTHLRLSLDGATIWENFEKQLPSYKTNVVFFHDPNLGAINGAADEVKRLLKFCSREKDHPAVIGAKFPIQVKSARDFKIWNDFTTSSDFFTLNITEILNDEEFIDIIDSSSKKGANKILYTIANPETQIDNFILEQLPKIFKQVIYCCRNHKRINLEIKEGTLIRQEWINVITLLNLYMSAAEKYTTVPALYTFCKNLRPKESRHKNVVICIEEARDIFLFVMENHPELFKMFYECNNVELRNGGLEDVSLRTRN